MAFEVDLKSKEGWLGDLVRSVRTLTSAGDFGRGSNTSVTLEALASALYEISVSSLKILQSTNLEALTGQQLDKKAESIRLPNGIGGYGRKPSTQSSGVITVGSGFAKISSKIYAGKPAPFAGSTVLYLEDASSFPGTGSVYLGRGTVDRFEGPIPYTSVVNSGSFWTITLSSPLTKSHLLSDIVTLSQGGNRLVPAGTVVQVPADSQSQAIPFTTTQDLIIPDGEAEGTVGAVCAIFGEVGNALTNSIREFTTIPFSGATVTNATSFSNGKSTESDEALRQRIKNYPATLSRGIKTAILAAITGATDSETGRTIQSAVILDPVESGDSAKGYIDDGTGLEPTFGAQDYELLLESASGQEKRFRTAQFPITAATAEGSEFAPYILTDGDSLSVSVDGVLETYTITPSNYENLNSATAYEVVRDLNTQSNLVGFRTIDGGKRIVMIDLSGEAEEITISSGNLQEVLGFPTSTLRPIFLYKNSELQSFRGVTATLETRPRNQWSVTLSDLADNRVKVDGVTVEFSIVDADFTEFGTTHATATATQYATVLSRKIPGVKFTASGQIIVWSSRNTFSESGSLEILDTKADGSNATWIAESGVWTPEALGGKLSDTGSPKSFDFNRFTGDISFTSKLQPSDKVEIASRNTRARIVSKVTDDGLFALSQNLATFGSARFVTAFDGDFLIRDVTTVTGAQFTPSLPDSSGASTVIRLAANDTGLFFNATVGDWLYLVKDSSKVTWGSAVEGFYRLKGVGLQKYATNQSYTSLSAVGKTFVGASVTVTKGSPAVTVIATDHGIQTGDLISSNTGLAIGGISSSNLSVTSKPAVKIDENTFTFEANASATSDASGTLGYVGTNIVIVTLANHGFESGALINTTVASGFAGISNTNLSVTAKPITVIDSDTFAYRALAPTSTFPMPSGGTVNTLAYVADCWVEFEVSSLQLADWTSILSTAQDLSDGMVNIFRSTAIPQLVDFGAVGSLTVDQAVSAINSQISSGLAVKINPQQFEIRSSDFTSGTVSVLAVIGNAENALEVGTSTSLQYHVGYSQSQNTRAGFPVVDSVELPSDPIDGYGTRTYLSVDHKFIDITNTSDNPAIESPTSLTPSYPEGFEHIWLTGRQSDLIGRVYNNQTSAPYTGIMRGDDSIRPLNTSDTEQTSPDTLDRYSNFGLRLRDLNINNNDRLVVEMDLNPTDKTVSVGLGKIAKIADIDAIAGSGKGQVISFQLKDPDDSNKNFFDNTSVYKNFDFTDFKLLTKSVGLYRMDVSDRALVLRSAAFGGQHKLRLSVRYPVLDDQPTIAVSHSNTYVDGFAALNLTAILPSNTLIAGSPLTSGTYKVVATLSGSLYDMRLTSGSINSGSQYQTGNVINISGPTPLAGSYLIDTATYASQSSASAATSIGLSTVTVTWTGHGLQTGDLVSINTSSSIGGLTPLQLSQSDTPVTVVDANTFSYAAGSTAASTDSGSLDTVTYGRVLFAAPGNGGITTALYSASTAPVRSWELLDVTLQDLADAINNYYPDFPVAAAEAIGSNISTTYITDATYLTYPQTPAYSGSDMSGAFDYHTFACKFSGEAGIWQYDSSTLANNIKATVQSVDAIYPTTADASGTSYSPINEEVYVVPTNTKTLSAWLNFSAASSLGLLANIERIQSDEKIQISSKLDGSAGAVRVTGVSANKIESFVEGNATEAGDSIKATILSADSKSLTKNSAVLIENSISSEIQRPYRLLPEGSSLTSANTDEIETFFRQTNSIKYIRVNQNTGRLLFLRDGMGTGQSEFLSAGNQITFTDLGDGLVQITGAQAGGSSGTGILSARVGDMMYVRPDSTSPFSYDQWCQSVATSGLSDGTNPEYLGYPVVHVIDENNIVVIAPNISTFNTVTLAGATAATDVIFLPAVWNEKNIRTNHAEGAKFNDFVNSGDCYYLIKKLGSGLVSVWLQNSTSEAADTMRLDDLSVSSDDFAVFGSQFNPVNQGTYKIVAHNGKNHMIVYNPQGGLDELIDANSLSNGGYGERKWRVGPLSGSERPIRILAGECVRIGDKLRISTPESTLTQWFNSEFFGSWTITKIGLSAFDFTGSLPHSYSSGSFDLSKTCPYVDFEIPNAPMGVTDTNGSYVDKFLIGVNRRSIGFVEGTPYTSIRMVVGTAVSPQSPELGDVFLVPNIASTKLSSTFGTKFTALSKAQYEERTYQGIDGYKIYAGLIREAHRIVDGLPTNTNLYPGVKAAGTFIEWLTPLIKTVKFSLLVAPKDGVTINSISDLIKSTVANYVNTLGVGQPIVISEVIRSVQSLPGVFSVQVVSTTPAYQDGKITVSESEKALILSASSDVTIG